jgi:hypothetical protein
MPRDVRSTCTPWFSHPTEVPPRLRQSRGRPFVYLATSFVTGEIESSTVPCLSAEQQVYFHQGYEPTDRDRQDMTQLRQSSGIRTHL